MTDEPAAYIAAALSSLGITFHSLVVSRYEPMVFGNLRASVETSAGTLRIIYDRGFFVEADQWPDDAPSMEEIMTELTLRREAANGS